MTQDPIELMAAKSENINVGIELLLDFTHFPERFIVSGGVGTVVYCLEYLDPGGFPKRAENAAGPDVSRFPVGEDVADFQYSDGSTSFARDGWRV